MIEHVKYLGAKNQLSLLPQLEGFEKRSIEVYEIWTVKRGSGGVTQNAGRGINEAARVEKFLYGRMT